VGLGGNGVLYVADSLGNQIVRIADALFRNTSASAGVMVSAGGSINDPLGLAIAPNGDILVTNGGDGNLVEVTPGGAQIAVKPVDATGIGGGTLFGLVVAPDRAGIYFVNDGNNTLDLLR
jgi:DNA-binding beta-propeller fold protein YncE